MSKRYNNYKELVRQSRLNLMRKFPSKTNQKASAMTLIIIILCFAGLLTYNYYKQNQPQNVLPPIPNTSNQTYDKVLSFIKNDDTNTIPYGEGFNCVDSVFRVWRNATWKGIVGLPIVIQYAEPPGHMVIGFPTVDKGDIFFETENDQQIRLSVGSTYGGKIIGIYVMNVIWTPVANSPPYNSNVDIK